MTDTPRSIRTLRMGLVACDAMLGTILRSTAMLSVPDSDSNVALSNQRYSLEIEQVISQSFLAKPYPARL